MSLLGQTDWTGVEAQQPVDGGYEPIPNGTYYFQITSVEDRPTQAGTGMYVLIIFECLDDAYKGQTVRGRYNLSNPNQTAVNIARKEIKALGDALGIVPTGPEVLVGKTLKLEVLVEQRSDNPAKMQNKINRYLPSGSAPPNPGLEKPASVSAGDEDTPF